MSQNTPLELPFDNSYARLPERLYARLPPTPVQAPGWLLFNDGLAIDLGLDRLALQGESGLQALAGNQVPAGAEPLAMVYAGHQFGGFSPQLGDGRALLLGEIIDRAGQRQDIQLKGSGPTPYSRRGDGRAWVGPVVREFVVSEAMHALGVPSTRALAAVSTGEKILRETGWLPGAVLTRVARSHLRVGTFEYFAAQRDLPALQTLVDYALVRHYPVRAQSDQPALALLEAVRDAQAMLVARWQSLGFIHGVMNTDNCSIGGDTIDYGPCAFMDHYDPDTMFSAVDTGGRYRYRHQPPIAHWNLVQLARALLPLIHDEPEQAADLAQAVVDDFMPRFDSAHRQMMLIKIGIDVQSSDDTARDDAILSDFLQLMFDQKADFTNTFRALCRTGYDAELDDQAPLVRELGSLESAETWARRWRARLANQEATAETMQARMLGVNPAIIPRNHVMEAMIQQVVDNDDGASVQPWLEALRKPWADQPPASPWVNPPAAHEIVQNTFCGT